MLKWGENEKKKNSAGWVQRIGKLLQVIRTFEYREKQTAQTIYIKNISETLQSRTSCFVWLSTPAWYQNKKGSIKSCGTADI
jgi:hypothetical protein